MPALILVRHAQASFGGPHYDVLSEMGHAQVRAVVAALERRDLRVERVLSGSLRRQVDTAQAIAALAGTQVQIDERWNEYDSTDVLSHHSSSAAREERVPDEEAPAISSREFQTVLDAALLDWIDAGDDGPTRESHPAFVARVREALAAAAAGLGSGGTAVVSTSGGVIGVVCAALLRADPGALIEFNRVTINTGLTKVVVGRAGMTLVSFNEHGHLEGGSPELLTYR